jgi:hypothetical protein
MEDKCIKNYIIALGSFLGGIPEEDLLEHAVQASRILHIAYYPERPGAIRNILLYDLEFLRLIWGNTDNL